MTESARQLTAAAGPALVLYAARRYLRNWGTPKEESRMHLPGDELMPQPVLQSKDGGEVILAEMAGPVTALVTRGMLRGIRRRAVHEPTCISHSATSQAPAR